MPAFASLISNLIKFKASWSCDSFVKYSLRWTKTISGMFLANIDDVGCMKWNYMVNGAKEKRANERTNETSEKIYDVSAEIV